MSTPIQRIAFGGVTAYVKRDDTIDYYLSGNKYRKLYTLLKEDFSTIKRIVSYGGIQSNAMLSIAALAHQKGVVFDYYVRYMPANIFSPSNFTYATKLGMRVHVLDSLNDEALGEEVKSYANKSTVVVHQGGANALAQEGVEVLANEIRTWQISQGIKDLVIALPSGTGTTALFLQEALQDVAQVVTTPCVKDANYLLFQMSRLCAHCKKPTILSPLKKYTFAKPHIDALTWYEYFKAQNIEFDLIYAPIMWQALFEHISMLEGKTLLYVHSGGVLGNASQRKRYESIIKS